LSERQRDLFRELSETFVPVGAIGSASAPEAHVASDQGTTGPGGGKRRRKAQPKGILDKVKDALGLDSDDE
jgi:hypothetical protein